MRYLMIVCFVVAGRDYPLFEWITSIAQVTLECGGIDTALWTLAIPAKRIGQD
jgi:hypothetical protein